MTSDRMLLLFFLYKVHYGRWRFGVLYCVAGNCERSMGKLGSHDMVSEGMKGDMWHAHLYMVLGQTAGKST